MRDAELWARYREGLHDDPELGFRLDLSRMEIPRAFFERMAAPTADGSPWPIAPPVRPNARWGGALDESPVSAWPDVLPSSTTMSRSCREAATACPSDPAVSPPVGDSRAA